MSDQNMNSSGAGAFHEKIQDFVEEMNSFAKTAEDTLTKIESDAEANKGLFSVFSERMFTIRGTALQLNLAHVANIAELGEEIAIKAVNAQSRSQIRKCVGALWDALTTVKYLLVHYDQPTNEEQEILINRLQSTLNAFGGARAKVSADDIEELLKQRG